MKAILVSIAWLLAARVGAQNVPVVVPTKFADAVPVLNLGTFHMGTTSDAHSTDFDEHNRKNVERVHRIAQSLAVFKPTVIVVEYPPQYDAGLLKEYLQYVADPKMTFKNPSEIELLAYEVGRLAGTRRIYGIDYAENYNYMINRFVAGKDSVTFNRYSQMFEDFIKKYPQEKMPLLQMLQLMNGTAFLDMMININADMLTHISSEGKAEGADEAAKFYHRNLVMYSNLNRIALTKDDRVFILMGAAHTAFFNDFMRRSPKYRLVDVFEFLK